jgi:phosphatidate cytidylyltransferase
VTRLISALVLLPVVLAAIVWLPPWGTFVLAGVVLLLGVSEYMDLALRGERQLPRLVVMLTAVAGFLSTGLPDVPVEVPLLATTVAVGVLAVGLGHPEDDVARRVGVALLPALYLGLPLGVMVAVRLRWGSLPLLAMLLTIMASDVAQYYGGRSLGRRPLAPAISPKKTLEGAIAGLVAGGIVLPWLGRAWLDGGSTALLVLVGITLAGLGIVGDLFESLLKRSAGVKDASHLIPGHGGILDRIDALLFAAPVYYFFLRYAL